MAIKVMIVDDESNIRKILRKVIEKNDGFVVEGESDNMTDALLLFNQIKPQVVFMDIEINKSSGIDCAKVMCDIEPKTKIIFATAHSEYMSNAFEMYAFDYLVKPFNIERIGHTLELLKKQYEEQEYVKKVSNNDSSDLEDSVVHSENVLNKNVLDNQVLIKSKDSLNFVQMADIVFIERNNSSTVIYTEDGECYVTSMSLSDIEEKLDMNTFIRSHKSYIINLSFIKKIEPYGRWTYIVKFKKLMQDALITKEKYEQIKKMYS